MIPKRMQAFLRERLPEQTWENRLICEQGLCYMEFNSKDVDRLARLGIEIDNLGPNLLVCMWDEEASLEVGGYLIVDNLAMGQPAMGGIRMLPDITPAEVAHRARGMTLKSAAANLPYGGGKVGIVADRSLTPAEHCEVIRRFSRLLYKYHPIFLPGPDVGTNDADMKTVAIENGLDNALSKPAEMGGSRVDQLGAAAGGIVVAIQALLEEMPRLKSLAQFAGLEVPQDGNLSVIIQGFGAVGAHTARILSQRIEGARVTGISDALGYLYDKEGLPVDMHFRIWQEKGNVTRHYFNDILLSDHWGVSRTKYSSAPNDLLRESAYCLIPASPVANYLDLEESSQPSITVNEMGKWSLIIEAANTYSPDRVRRSARARMEREVYRNRGILIVPDFLVNSGGLIFAAQEHLIRTPTNLRIPNELLGNRDQVDTWIQEHADQLKKLAEKRYKAGDASREEVIRRNMREFIDMLVADADMLPSEAAEKISIRRVIHRESDRTAAEIMIPMGTIPARRCIQEAAQLLIDSKTPILAVIGDNGEVCGILTDWDVTRAAAENIHSERPVESIMTHQVIAVKLGDSILKIIKTLENCEISAMPVVDEGKVVGMVSIDLLAHRTLLRLLQSQED